MDKNLKSAKLFVSKICKLKPDEFVKKIKELHEEHKKMNVSTKEFDRMFKDYARDRDTIKEIKASFSNYATIDMLKIKELRAKFTSARYFKDNSTELKLIDFQIRVLIKTYKESLNKEANVQQQEANVITTKVEPEEDTNQVAKMDEEKLNTEESAKKDSVAEATTEVMAMKPIIDYSQLKQLYDGVRLHEKFKKENKDKIRIKEENCIFITRLYKKCKEYIKKTILAKSLLELETGEFEKHYKNFVDLTGPILDFKVRLNERSAQLKNKKQRKVIAPSGLKASHKRLLKFDVSNEKTKEEI